jgi:hypothetical protein
MSSPKIYAHADFVVLGEAEGLIDQLVAARPRPAYGPHRRPYDQDSDERLEVEGNQCVVLDDQHVDARLTRGQHP